MLTYIPEHVIKARVSRHTAPCILNLRTRQRCMVRFIPPPPPPPFCSWGKYPCIHFIRGWVNPTFGLDTLKVKESISCLCWECNPSAIQPVALLLYRLCLTCSTCTQTYTLERNMSLFFLLPTCFTILGH